jgi:SAM-dependent methyltransferase
MSTAREAAPRDITKRPAPIAEHGSGPGLGSGSGAASPSAPGAHREHASGNTRAGDTRAGSAREDDDIRVADARAGDARVSAPRASDTQVSDTQVSDTRTADARVSDARVSDAHAADASAPSSVAVNGHGRSAPMQGRGTPRPWSADPYSDALLAGRGPLFLRRSDGWLLPLEVERWCADADAVDMEVLGRCEGAVLDVGCGPGRLVAELAARGRPALGIDVSEAAVAHTLRLGGQALRRSVFEPLPGEGRWNTALLVDGNVGIGGDPAALLRRMSQLLDPGGLLIAETVPDVDVDERVSVHIVRSPHTRVTDSHGDNHRADSHGAAGPAFPWARLSTPALLRHATRAGWRPDGQWATGGRSFAALRNRRRRTNSTAEPPNSTAVTSSQRPRKTSPGRPVADS